MGGVIHASFGKPGGSIYADFGNFGGLKYGFFVRARRLGLKGDQTAGIFVKTGGSMYGVFVK